MLKEILKNKQKEIDQLHSDYGLPFFKQKVKASRIKPLDFVQSMSSNGLQLIAEVKKKSPSAGILYEDFDPVSLSIYFMDQGAQALSVLTDHKYFSGSPMFVPLIRNRVTIPILRKDFILEPIQIYESRYLGADAILLIASILDPETIKNFVEIAQSMSLDVLVEVHNEDELESIKALPISIIGINNRDLHTFKVDKATVSRMLPLVRHAFPQAMVIAESGYETRKDLMDLEEDGADAVLIGGGLAKDNAMLSFFKS
ncbi:MAG: indole-3-glycerol phosphate synthase TrpC [Candidatus Margulisbacteria bacterium]|nr:indole-3-glycerol phosphate synthase TrpC [Candidatus Margulisiibacteriota bacterium]